MVISDVTMGKKVEHRLGAPNWMNRVFRLVVPYAIEVQEVCDDCAIARVSPDLHLALYPGHLG